MRYMYEPRVTAGAMFMPKDTPNVIDFSLRRARAKREDLLGRVIRDHGSAIRRFLRARLANHPDYEDLVQDIYVKLARLDNLDQKLSMGAAQTRSYLFSIATNLIRDRYRRDSIRQEVKRSLAEEEGYENHMPSPEDILISHQSLNAIRKAILRLSFSCRRAFLLSRFENLSYREIAEQMNISISMVEKHIMRALAEIRSCVQL